MPKHDLAAELRALRRDKLKPISKMRVADISAEIEALKHQRESQPPAASYSTAPPSKSRSAVETLKEAKAMEFPVEPSAAAKKTMPKKTPAEPKKMPAHKAATPAGEKKKSKLARLMEMMDEDE